ncbi:MAG: AAA family ATPase [Gemmatimonadetes bacterium]|nr:AAA family ATPase [Gemmatimonadota bacterium]
MNENRTSEGSLLRAVRLGHPPASRRDTFPFSIPALKGLGEIAFPGPVTILAGENGSGKSTLLEALAIVANLPTVGGAEARLDDSLAGPRGLARAITPVWGRRTHRGFFLRAEDFFGFIRRLGVLQTEMEARLEEVDREYRGRSELARKLARGPAAGSLADMRSRYGDDLDANSHGESFLKLFRARFVPEGLYLLDEPEAALSPQSQLGFVSMMSDMVNEGGQFIVATHSPVLMAVPGATIYSFDSSPLQAVAYDALEGVELLKGFLQAPERYMRHIWRPRA